MAKERKTVRMGEMCCERCVGWAFSGLQNPRSLDNIMLAYITAKHDMDNGNNDRALQSIKGVSTATVFG
jgi:hypothetical protein